MLELRAYSRLGTFDPGFWQYGQIILNENTDFHAKNAIFNKSDFKFFFVSWSKLEFKNLIEFQKCPKSSMQIYDGST
jgi:hypothetical protein